MDSAVRTQRSWADLQTDLLTSIGNLLDAVSYLRSSAVCTSWASALHPNRPNLPPVRPNQSTPWLLLSAENLETNPTNTHFTFYDILTRTSYKTPIRYLSGQHWLGSNSGWLVTHDRLCNLHLIKPLYGDCVSLPSVTTIPLSRRVVSGNYDSNGELVGYCGMDLKKFSRSFFKKVIICRTPDCEDGFLVVGLFGRFHLAVARAGDKKWTLLDDLKRVYYDAIFFNRKLYAITDNSLQCWDLEETSFGPRRIVRSFNTNHDFWSKYLVEVRGELVMVCRIGQFRHSTVQNFKTIDVRVFKLNDNLDNADNFLDDAAIFLGTSYSKAVSTVDLDGLKGNCVYFTDDLFWAFMSPNGPNFNRDILVFDLEDKTSQPLYPQEQLVNWPPPIWFWSS